MRLAAKIILGAAALSRRCHRTASSRAEDHLNVGIPSPAYDFALLSVGIDADIFKDNGLDITPIELAGSAKLHQALIAGSIEIAMGAGTDLLFIAKGAPEKAIADMAGPPNNMALIVASKGPIKTVADLKGKKIGVSTVGSLTYWLAQQLSIRQGWGPNGIEIVAVGGMQGEAAGLIDGNLQGGVGSLEGGLEMADKGEGRILVMFGDFVHPFLAHAIFATNATIAQHPISSAASSKAGSRPSNSRRRIRPRRSAIRRGSRISRTRMPSRSISTRRRCSRPTAASISKRSRW